ncbi:MAG TPA: outer membrane protein assembly factor BamE [Xanthobacteraceae bacterium]|nr:outer membrane protein assembly factor BamE [Xanthobacteraceae bacterium]
MVARGTGLSAALAATLAAAACSNLPPSTGSLGLSRQPTGFVSERQRGYVLSDGALEQIPVGSSQEQVLLVLGTPSTVATVDGEVFYYISQKTKKLMFLKPEVVEQRVLAIYFDKKDKRVVRIADYGLQDGKVFDFISRTTPTSGSELSILGQIFTASGVL